MPPLLGSRRANDRLLPGDDAPPDGVSAEFAVLPRIADRAPSEGASRPIADLYEYLATRGFGHVETAWLSDAPAPGASASGAHPLGRAPV